MQRDELHISRLSYTAVTQLWKPHLMNTDRPSLTVHSAAAVCITKACTGVTS
jgi:hypothetical protein